MYKTSVYKVSVLIHLLFSTIQLNAAECPQLEIECAADKIVDQVKSRTFLYHSDDDASDELKRTLVEYLQRWARNDEMTSSLRSVELVADNFFEGGIELKLLEEGKEITRTAVQPSALGDTFDSNRLEHFCFTVEEHQKGPLMGVPDTMRIELKAKLGTLVSGMGFLFQDLQKMPLRADFLELLKCVTVKQDVEYLEINSDQDGELQSCIFGAVFFHNGNVKCSCRDFVQAVLAGHAGYLDITFMKFTEITPLLKKELADQTAMVKAAR